jgi:hypothetical protein
MALCCRAVLISESFSSAPEGHCHPIRGTPDINPRSFSQLKGKWSVIAISFFSYQREKCHHTFFLKNIPLPLAAGKEKKLKQVIILT